MFKIVGIFILRLSLFVAWCHPDGLQLLRGAALNAVIIAEKMLL
jgi:hypothetical protein